MDQILDLRPETTASIQHVQLSSRRRRIAAFMIDYLVISFISFSLFFLTQGPGFAEDGDPNSFGLIMLIAVLPGFILFLAKDAINGMSPGRWIMGITVRESADPDKTPSLPISLVRNLFLVILFPIEFIVMAVSRDKQRIGDKVGRTQVLVNPEKAGRLPRILTLVGIVVAFFTFSAGMGSLMIKNSEAYKVAIRAIEQNEEILTETGGIKGYGTFATGKIAYDDNNGEAGLEIKVLGNKKDVEVRAYLKKQGSGWELINLQKQEP